MSNTAHLAQGRTAEAQACLYLQQQGLVLLERNYRCRLGEIDLIMTHGDSTVFVEVRYRRSNRYGSGAESVNSRKQQKLIAAAQSYLQLHRPLANKPARFDVVSMHQEKQSTHIDWIQDAFQTA